MNVVKNCILISAMAFLFIGCTFRNDRTDAEMLQTAVEVYQDYLFEYGIDGTLFSSPIVKTNQNEYRSYKWMARGSESEPVGVEVIVTKMKNTKPNMVLIGNTKTWLPYVGSKNKTDLMGH